jgi:hypothetical protein
MARQNCLLDGTMREPLTLGLGHDGSVEFYRLLTSFRRTANRTVGVVVSTVLAALGIAMLCSPSVGGTLPAIQDQTSKIPHPIGSTVGCSTAVATAPMLGKVDLRIATGLLEPSSSIHSSDRPQPRSALRRTEMIAASACTRSVRPV